MKCAAVASLFFCGSLASSLVSSTPESRGLPELARRDDVNIVAEALYNISNSTTALNKDISTFTVGTILNLQTVSFGAVQTIYDANTAVKGSPVLTVEQATSLIPIIQSLAMLVQTTINNTIAHKEQFGGVAPVVLANIQQQQNATISFTATVTTKLPASLVQASATLTKPILDALSQGIAAFQAPNVNPPSVYALPSAAASVNSFGVLALALLVAGVASLSGCV